MKDKQMPVITDQEKKSVLSYIKNHSKKDLKTYKLRCGQCHDVPEIEKLIPDAWKDLIVVLDGDMPVFSEEEKASVIRYLQTFAKR
jgi:bifunctional N-acetylglucosamine-1-phosphate-uridyltransferase/glucosamine-1-phosphate-acetyltransferase GlmU-like protein